MKICRHRKPFAVLGRICVAIAAVIIFGCNASHAPVRSGDESGKDSSVERIRISALTEFVPNSAVSGQIQIKALVELVDIFDSSVKAPCVLRFELYEFRALSSDSRGRRLLIWPDENLIDSDTNDEYWKDFLRGYEFLLPLKFSPKQGKKYILEATCIVGQKRFNDIFKIQYQP